MKRRRHIHRHKRSPYKQGIYNPVVREKYKGCKSPEYRSSWELKFFQWCDKNPNVLEWGSESVVVPYKSPVDNRYHRYFIDGIISLKEGNNITRYLIEIKPYNQTVPPIESSRKKRSTILYEKVTYAVNRAKWEAAEKFAKKRNMSFIILTENELNIR
jgi:hypothetical protein|tara:strand:- start:1287 stop:1760 length:474 start_codon:yes stop_codon:yes gene_type:complete